MPTMKETRAIAKATNIIRGMDIDPDDDIDFEEVVSEVKGELKAAKIKLDGRTVRRLVKEERKRMEAVNAENERISKDRTDELLRLGDEWPEQPNAAIAVAAIHEAVKYAGSWKAFDELTSEVRSLVDDIASFKK